MVAKESAVKRPRLVPHRLELGLVLALAPLVACDEKTTDGDASEGADEADPTGDPTDADTQGDPELLVGSFELLLSEQSGVTLFGKIYDGETPRTLIWEAQLESAECVLSTPRVPFCSTPCGGSAACIEDETCQAYPSPLGAGDVLVSGVRTEAGDASFTMTPIADNYQVPVGTVLADPPFAAGEQVSLEAQGDAVAAFEITATAIDPLVLANSAIELHPVTSLLLEWTPGNADSRVHVALDISHHGGTKGKIECDAPDSGALTIPADMIAALLDLGVAGFPTIIVTRESTGSVVTALGRIDLVLASKIERAVTIAGLVSCTEDADCPDGQTCQPNLTCQ